MRARLVPVALTLALALAGIAACAGGSGTTSATDAEASTTSSSSSSGSSSSTDGMSSTTTSTSTSTTAPETAGCGFVCADLGTTGEVCSTPSEYACDLWGWGDEDCCEGEKCNSWASDGGGSWNSTKCVPVDPNPDKVGEPCTVVGDGTSGVDSCEKGSMCWDVDPKTKTGTCVRLCSGDPECWSDDAACCPVGFSCYIAGASSLILCLADCQPLLQDCEDPKDACYPVNDSFQCAPDVSGDLGAVGDPCELLNACDPGNYCGDPSTWSKCDPDAVGCCLPFCDLGDPKCVDGTECAPWYDPMDAPPHAKDLGACVSPP
ncbi:MAG: hypothetical protein R3B09_23600 [Nannocystaceae bacterium]